MRAAARQLRAQSGDGPATDLTRYAKKLTEERTRETQRLQRVLEDAGIKLDSVASDVMGRSARAMLEALIAGERDRLCSPTSPRPGCG